MESVYFRISTGTKVPGRLGYNVKVGGNMGLYVHRNHVRLIRDGEVGGSGIFFYL